MLTGRQQAEFRPLVKRAWAEVCRRSGWVDTPSGREKWYRAEVKSVIGVESSRDADQVQDFDRLMLHFATIANDDQQIRYFSAAEERRALHRLRALQARAAKAGSPLPDEYVRGIQKQMGYGTGMLQDLPAEAVQKIATACAVYLKRSFVGG